MRQSSGESISFDLEIVLARHRCEIYIFYHLKIKFGEHCKNNVRLVVALICVYWNVGSHV